MTLGPGARRALEREAATQAARTTLYAKHGWRWAQVGTRPPYNRGRGVPVFDLIRIDA